MGERYKDEKRDKKEFFRGGPLGVEDMVVLGGRGPSLRQKIMNQDIKRGKARLPWFHSYTWTCAIISHKNKK